MEVNSNHLLYWRKRRNLSLQKLSARIETNGNNFASPKTINRWEKGETSIPEWANSELARALKISEEELFHGPKEGKPLNPIQFSAAYTGLDLEIAEHLINMSYTSWIASRPLEARRAMESVLPWLEAAQRRAPISSHIKQGNHLLARGYELLGALAIDQLENDSAIAYYRRALTMSEELHDTNLIVAHMTELGDAFRRKGEKELAIGYMNAALEKAENVERSTRGYILEMLAYSYADIGNEQSFKRYISEAVDYLGHTGEGSGAGKRDFIPFEVLEISGKAMRDFGHPLLALQYFEQAEQTLFSRPNVPRWQALLTISKAQALCDCGELEEGIRLAIKGITLAHSCNSLRQMNRVRKLIRKLDESDYKDSPALIPMREIVKDIYVGNRNPLEWKPMHAM